MGLINDIMFWSYNALLYPVCALTFHALALVLASFFGMWFFRVYKMYGCGT